MARSMLSSMVVAPSYQREWPRVVRGEGIYLWDESGRRFIDGSGCSSAVTSIGHGSARVATIMAEQARAVAITPTHEFVHAQVEAYCDELVDFAPANMRMAWTASSGSDAVESALKLALQYHWMRGETDRTIVLGRRQSWHGATLGALGVGGNTLRREPFEGALPEAPTIPAPYCYRCPLGADPETCATACAEEVRRAILAAGADRVAALIVEPVIGATLGAVVPPPGYLTRVREICDEHGVLLIADEVLTGAGRTGRRFGVDHENVEPDVIAWGKGFSGGYVPLSGVLISERVAEPYLTSDTPFMSGHTHACSPLSAAVGRVVLEELEILLDSGHVEASSSALHGALQQGLEPLRSVGDVRGVGMLAGIELVADRRTKEPYPTRVGFLGHVVRAAFDRGLIVYPGRGSAGSSGEHLKLAPPLTTTVEEARMIAEIVVESIAEAEAAIGEVA